MRGGVWGRGVVSTCWTGALAAYCARSSRGDSEASEKLRDGRPGQQSSCWVHPPIFFRRPGAGSIQGLGGNAHVCTPLRVSCDLCDCFRSGRATRDPTSDCSSSKK